MNLTIEPDAYGDLTLWDHTAQPPLALAQELSVHPTVWRLIEAALTFTNTIEET